MADTQARFTHLFDSLLMCCRLVATRHKSQNYLACRGWLTRCGEFTEPKSVANENKTLRAAGIDDLVGSRYIWLRNPDKWSQKDEDTPDFDGLSPQSLAVQ